MLIIVPWVLRVADEGSYIMRGLVGWLKILLPNHCSIGSTRPVPTYTKLIGITAKKKIESVINMHLCIKKIWVLLYLTLLFQ